MLGIKCFTFLSLLVFCQAEDDELIAVTTLIRHGARIPLSFYPTDPYRNFPWPFVLGDLTNEGIREMYDVGKWLRETYNDFLSQRYDPNELYAHSVEFDRCLMTAESVFAGLYPVIGDRMWQPIPIHSSPNSQDILTNEIAPCPGKFRAAGDAMRNASGYPEIMKKYGPIFEFISEHAQENITFTSLYTFFDTLFSEKELGFQLPYWAEKVYPDLFPLIVLYTKMSSLTPLERKMQAGPLTTRILNQFENAISGENFGTTKTIYRKFMAYFSTEWMLYDFTYGLGLKSIGVPKYGALYLIELRKKQEDYYVNIFWRNNSVPGTKAEPWHFEGEKFNLKFDTFKKIAEPMRLNTTRWVRLCDRFTHKNSTVVTGVPMS